MHTSTPLSLPELSAFHSWAMTNCPRTFQRLVRWRPRSLMRSCHRIMWSEKASSCMAKTSVFSQSIPLPNLSPPALELDVIRRLNTGSYAIIYLVREVLSSFSFEGMESNDTVTSHASVEYGHDFVIKCLSKANLDARALAAQMTEVIPIIPQFTGQC
jgi:hypothetical protein